MKSSKFSMISDSACFYSMFMGWVLWDVLHFFELRGGSIWLFQASVPGASAAWVLFVHVCAVLSLFTHSSLFPRASETSGLSHQWHLFETWLAQSARGREEHCEPLVAHWTRCRRTCRHMLWTSVNMFKGRLTAWSWSLPRVCLLESVDSIVLRTSTWCGSVFLVTTNTIKKRSKGSRLLLGGSDVCPGWPYDPHHWCFAGRKHAGTPRRCKSGRLARTSPELLRRHGAGREGAKLPGDHGSVYSVHQTGSNNWAFHKWGYPIAGWFVMENPKQMGELGVPSLGNLLKYVRVMNKLKNDENDKGDWGTRIGSPLHTPCQHRSGWSWPS